jgi:hypothetical protein
MAPSHASGSGLPMRPASDIPRTYAGNLEHSQLVRLIADANGAQVQEPGQIWNGLGSEVIEFGTSLQRTATSSETIWIGQAATAARARLNDLVNWCAQTGRGLQHMGTTVMRTQGEAAETAQRSMPAPVPYDPSAYQNRINATSNPAEWVQIMGDAREQAARHNAAHAEAVRVVETYSTSLLSTNGTMPAFTPPPEFGNGDTGPGSGTSTPDGGAGSGGGPGGSLGGGHPPIVPKSGSDAPGGNNPVHRSPVHPGPGPGDPTHPGPGPVPPLAPGPAPSDPAPPSDPDQPPVGVPPADTPPTVKTPIPGTHGPGIPAGQGGGNGGAGVPCLPPAAGIGALGAGGHGSSVSRSGGGFGPRGSSPMTALERGIGSTGESESVTGAGRGAASVAGRGLGAGGAVPPMVGGGQSRGKEDSEHRRPSYLIETEDIWGDGRRVVPPVIGADPPESTE